MKTGTCVMFLSSWLHKNVNNVAYSITSQFNVDKYGIVPYMSESHEVAR